jgi:hypothetical protein
MPPAALALSAALLAQPGPGPAPLPEGNAYVRALVERHRQRERALDSYAYDLRETREEIDGRGRVRKRDSRRYEVFHVEGRPVRTLVEENGKVLARERAKGEAAEARRQAAAIARGDVAVEQPAPRLSRLLEESHFTTTGREEVAGRPALVLEFAPRPGAAASGGLRLAGRVWIDEEEGQVARAELHNTESLRVKGGLAASLKTLEVSLEFRKVDDLVWLPLLRRASVEGRRFPFQSFRLRTTARYGPFRRFTVDAQEQER